MLMGIRTKRPMTPPATAAIWPAVLKKAKGLLVPIDVVDEFVDVLLEDRD